MASIVNKATRELEVVIEINMDDNIAAPTDLLLGG